MLGAFENRSERTIGERLEIDEIGRLTRGEIAGLVFDRERFGTRARPRRPRSPSAELLSTDQVWIGIVAVLKRQDAGIDNDTVADLDGPLDRRG